LRAARLMSDTSRLDVLALWNSHSTARNAPDPSFHRILGNAIGWHEGITGREFVLRRRKLA
jgi:hypothetical protein